MIKTVIQVDGMMCSMCEAHINDAIRNAFSVKKVKSSRKKNLTEVQSESPLDSEKLRTVIEELGYTVGNITAE